MAILGAKRAILGRRTDGESEKPFYLTLKTWSLGPGQSSMALPVAKVSGFSAQVSVVLFFFPDT
jgi:hypothetical protein